MIQNIVLLGSGNVATNLGLAFYEFGLNILQVYSREAQNAAVLANRVNAEPITEIKGLTSDADLYLFCVSDKAIAPLAEAIAFEPALVAHTSGSIGISELSRFKKHGVFYPLQTFSKGRELNLGTVPFFIEGNDSMAVATLYELAQKLSKQVSELSSEQRVQLHLAAVFANNFVNHFYGIAAQMLQHQGVPFKVMEPLLHETLRKAIEIGPDKAQTGPAVRGDVKVMERHKQLIKDAQIEKLYSFVSESIYQKYHNK